VALYTCRRCSRCFPPRQRERRPRAPESRGQRRPRRDRAAREGTLDGDPADDPLPEGRRRVEEGVEHVEAALAMGDDEDPREELEAPSDLFRFLPDGRLGFDRDALKAHANTLEPSHLRIEVLADPTWPWAAARNGVEGGSDLDDRVGQESWDQQDCRTAEAFSDSTRRLFRVVEGFLIGRCHVVHRSPPVVRRHPSNTFEEVLYHHLQPCGSRGNPDGTLGEAASRAAIRARPGPVQNLTPAGLLGRRVVLGQRRDEEYKIPVYVLVDNAGLSGVSSRCMIP